MDITQLRIATTVLSFIIFVGIIVWAYSRSNKANFSEAAKLPLQEDDINHE